MKSEMIFFRVKVYISFGEMNIFDLALARKT